MSAADWVALAALRRARGIKGELVAESLGSHPERFQPGLHVTLTESPDARGGRPVVLERAWWQQDLVILKFAGIDTRNDAEALRGWFVCVPEEDRPPLDEGQVYLSDLVGCSVEALDGRKIGEVTGWQDVGGPVLLEVGDDLLIPYEKAICQEVDLAGRRIRVDLPEGLEELNRK